MNDKEIEYKKCRKCRKELPSDGFTDGVCSSCLMDKHYCEDCEHCELCDREDADQSIEFAKCKASPKQGDCYSKTLLAKRFDNRPVEFYYCTSERTSNQCENFKLDTEELL
jgi:hypothetical protein